MISSCLAPSPDLIAVKAWSLNMGVSSTSFPRRRAQRRSRSTVGLSVEATVASTPIRLPLSIAAEAMGSSIRRTGTSTSREAISTADRAAEHLFVAQPSVTQTIRRLESELGTELFIRKGRGLVLSPSGVALVGPAREVVRALDVARETVAAVNGLRGGRLRIASCRRRWSAR
jgi:hypothetical protein